MTTSLIVSMIPPADPDVLRQRCASLGESQIPPPSPAQRQSSVRSAGGQNVNKKAYMSYHRRMALQLPGEPRYRFVEILLAVIAVLGLCALGCATPRTHSRRYPASVFEAARYEARKQPQCARASPSQGGGGGRSVCVVRTLHAAGLRFGTDGSTRALWGYMRTAHRLVEPPAVRPGDILFFDTLGTGERPACADHAGVVERMAADRRFGFIELRAGRFQHSFVNPAHPAERRGARGEILNSFLRPLRADDPAGARYFAGEMLWASRAPDVQGDLIEVTRTRPSPLVALSVAETDRAR